MSDRKTNAAPLTDMLRLDAVKRWGIVRVSREQSVAEHTFNVQAIALAIWQSVHEQKLRETRAGDIADLLLYALTHDLPESITGDINSRMKRLLPDEVMPDIERQLFPALVLAQHEASSLAKEIVKAADVIEAVRYLILHGVDADAARVCKELLSYAGYLVKRLPGSYPVLKQVISLSAWTPGQAAEYLDHAINVAAPPTQ